jgi:DNA-directed RNA polymerase subunit K/omega
VKVPNTLSVRQKNEDIVVSLREIAAGKVTIKEEKEEIETIAEIEEEKEEIEDKL